MIYIFYFLGHLFLISSSALCLISIICSCIYIERIHKLHIPHEKCIYPCCPNEENSHYRLPFEYQCNTFAEIPNGVTF